MGPLAHNKKSPKVVRVGMFALTLPQAEFWSNVSNGALFFGATVVALATLGVIATGAAKEHFADERISANEAETARADEAAALAKENAASANERAATLEKDAAAARLETERIKKQFAWRDVTPDQSAKIVGALYGAHMQITVSWPAGDAESSEFARRLATTFMKAGAEISAFAPSGFLGEEPHGLSVSGSERQEVMLLGKTLALAGFAPVDLQFDAPKADGAKSYTHLLVGYRDPPIVEPLGSAN